MYVTDNTIKYMYFDIGANVGKWALANINSCDRIISIEASPITFNMLVNNCKHDNITLLNYAICNNDRKDITFYQSDAHTISTINKDWLSHPKSRFYQYANYKEIRCRTLLMDDLIEHYGMPDLIKVDVEGGEYECISSLTQKVPLLCFEWASELNDISIKCIDYLYNLGFNKFYIQYEDAYTFRPKDSDFYDMNTVKTKLFSSISEKDWKLNWGMIWCK
jgi:FkbM family methyltransferase